VLAVIAAVNSVIAFFYYSNIIRMMWFRAPAPEHGDGGVIRVPPALAGAIGVTSAITVVVGIYPQVFARVGELATHVS
jgi:NADH-quinone oxidoreductase subunit N